MDVKEEDEKAGDEEFVDKEHESEFCLETNFMNKGEHEEKSVQNHNDGKK